MIQYTEIMEEVLKSLVELTDPRKAYQICEMQTTRKKSHCCFFTKLMNNYYKHGRAP
jgi:hypothetical protein